MPPTGKTPELGLFIPLSYRVERKPRPALLRLPRRPPPCLAEHRLKIALFLILLASIHIFVFLAIRQGSSRLRLVVSRPSISDSAPRFANTPADFLALARLVHLDACRLSSGYDVPGPNLVFHFSLISADGNVTRLGPGPQCLRHWQAPSEGLYALSVAVFREEEESVSLILEGSTEFMVQDIWVVVLGDSFASGQGNPDKPIGERGEGSPAEWLDGECQRSSESWAFRTYARLRAAHPQAGVLFTFLACAGASIRDGLVPTQESGRSQLGTLAGIQAASAWLSSSGEVLVPDAVLMSVGGNDMGISELLFAILWGSSDRLRSGVPARIAALERDFRMMAEYMRERIKLRDPANVFLLEYYDIAHNERGLADASCPGLFAATDADLEFASASILSPLNRQLASLAANYGWSFVPGIQAEFGRHGYCSRSSYIVSVEGSFRGQGTCYGAFHPNAAGHHAVADRLWPLLHHALNHSPT